MKPKDEIIQKFFENRCSEDEHNLMIFYLNSLPDNELDAFMESHIEKVDNEEVIFDESYRPDFNGILKKLHIRHKQSILSRRKFTYLIAASIAFFMILSVGGLYLSGIFNKKSPQMIWSEQITGSGQKSILILPDETKVILRADSRIKYPNHFENSIREVYLEGEAYFEVAHAPDKPFIVHSGNIKTTVLGTKFNVKSYPDEEEIIVSLVEGKVKISNGHIQEKFLDPNRQLSYNKNTGEGKEGSFDSLQVTGWKNNILVFNDTPLKKVFIELGRAYGVKFELADQSLLKQKIKANFENLSLPAVMKILKSVTKLEYKIENKQGEIQKITFYKEKKE
jgi:transmembrane sensor